MSAYDGALNGASPVVIEGISFCDAQCGKSAGDGVMISDSEGCTVDANGVVSAASSATGPTATTAANHIFSAATALSGSILDRCQRILRPHEGLAATSAASGFVSTASATETTATTANSIVDGDQLKASIEKLAASTDPRHRRVLELMRTAFVDQQGPVDGATLLARLEAFRDDMLNELMGV